MWWGKLPLLKRSLDSLSLFKKETKHLYQALKLGNKEIFFNRFCVLNGCLFSCYTAMFTLETLECYMYIPLIIPPLYHFFLIMDH